MFPFATNRGREDKDIAMAIEKGVLASAEGQRHNRIPDDVALTGPPTAFVPERDQNGDVDITAGQKMVAAMSGSLLTSLIVTPLDVVRVRLQSQPAPSPLAAVQKLAASSPQTFATPNLGVTACCREVFFINNHAEYCVAGTRGNGVASSAAATGAECAVEETQRRAFTSTFDGLRKIARNEGITTLWRGLSPTLVMTVPANIIYFTGYDWLRFNKASPIKKVIPDSYAPLAAGAFARIVAAMVVSPIEMFRTRMQASTSTSGNSHFAETFSSVREMVSIRGYASLWRGLTLTLWRDVPFSGIYWWGYETIRGSLTEARERARGRSIDLDGPRSDARRRSQSRDNHAETFTDSFAAGALSGATASILTMPFDVGKTRRQVFKDKIDLPQEKNRVLAPAERSMPQFLWHIFKTEGIAGLWRGWIPRTLKVAPACAIMISSYEVGKRMARSVNEKASERRAAL